MEFSLDLVLKILTAVGLGALIGVERGRQKNPHDKKMDTSGLRTFSIIALLGFSGAYLSEKWGVGILIIAFVLAGSLIISAYWQEAQKFNFIGITSELSELLVFLLGALAFWEQKTAILIAAIVLLVLTLKRPLRRFSQKVSSEEMTAIIKFIIVAFVVLPLLPKEPLGPCSMTFLDKTIDPCQVIVPYKAWLMVIFISGISFLGYILTKIIGAEKGIEITGLVGGLASSTATTSSMANSSKKNTTIVAPFAFAVVGASSIMFIRMGFTVFVINQELFKTLFIPLALITLVCGGALFYLFKKEKQKTKSKSEPLALQSPFQLKPALLFGLFYIFILVVADFMHVFFGNEGLLLASAVAGLTDVDAITLSLSELTNDQKISHTVATQGILIAALVNTTVKMFMARIFGGKEFAKLTTKAFGIILLGGIVSVVVVWLV